MKRRLSIFYHLKGSCQARFEINPVIGFIERLVIIKPTIFWRKISNGRF